MCILVHSILGAAALMSRYLELHPMDAMVEFMRETLKERSAESYIGSAVLFPMSKTFRSVSILDDSFLQLVSMETLSS
jgi:hypothetical protein